METRIAILEDEIYGKHIDPSIITDSDLIEMILKEFKMLKERIRKCEIKKEFGL